MLGEEDVFLGKSSVVLKVQLIRHALLSGGGVGNDAFGVQVVRCTNTQLTKVAFLFNRINHGLQIGLGMNFL